MHPTPTLTADRTLAELAVGHAGASRVLHRHGLDFCCGGSATLRAACAARALDADAVLAELAAAAPPPVVDLSAWSLAPLVDLVDFVEQRFHAAHRVELPRLQELARKVERVHADKPACPRGLAAFLDELEASLEAHMQKEERVLFPLIRAGRGPEARMPVQVMEREHHDHGENLARLRALTNDLSAPPDACGTWRALYLGLAQLERDLMEHIALENHVLFPRALRG